MKITLRALSLFSFVTSSTLKYSIAKKLNAPGVTSYSSDNNDRQNLTTTPTWQKRGGLFGPRDETFEIAEPSCFDFFLKNSRSMSLSASGNVLAIGYESNSYSTRCYYSRTGGLVEVFEYNATQQRWLARGRTLPNKGSRVSLSADGNILITGQHEGGSGFGEGSGAGIVYAFHFDVVTQDWKPMGEILNLLDNPNEVARWHFGYSVATSGNGQMVAIGHPGKSSSDFYEGTGYYDPFTRGRTHVYRHNGDATWTRVGKDIEGRADRQELGRIVSLSQDGLVVAMASLSYVQVYQINARDEWIQLGTDIENGNLVSIGLSTNGRYIAVVFHSITAAYPGQNYQGVVYKYTPSDNKWTALLENNTWLSGSDQKVLSIVDDGEEILFKHQGDSASSYGRTKPAIVAHDEEGNGIQAEIFSISNIDASSLDSASEVNSSKSESSKKKSYKSKSYKGKSSKNNSSTSETSYSSKSKKQPKETKSHKHSSSSAKNFKNFGKVNAAKIK